MNIDYCQLNHVVCDDATTQHRVYVARRVSVLMRACGQSCAVRGVGRPRTGRRPDASRHLARHAHGHQMGTQQPAAARHGGGPAQARPAHGPAAHPAAFWPTSPRRHPTRGRLSVPWMPLVCGARRAPARRFLALSLSGPKARGFQDTASASTTPKEKWLSLCSLLRRWLSPCAPRSSACRWMPPWRPPPRRRCRSSRCARRRRPTHSRAHAPHTQHHERTLGSHPVLGCGIGLCSECRLSHVLPRYSCACRRCALATRPLPVTCRLTR